MSKNIVLDNLDQPAILEEIYHHSPAIFEAALEEALTQQRNSETLRVWQARINYSPSASSAKISVTFLILLCLAAGAFTKIPAFIPVNGDWFYPRFLPLISLTAIIIYFLKRENNASIQKLITAGVIACIGFLLILPDIEHSDSITMALLHLPLFSLSLLAVSFMSSQWKNSEARLSFIQYMGEMGIYTVLILFGGIVLTAVTLGLFMLINLSIEEWYIDYVVVLGIVSSPLVATYLYDSMQNRQSKLSPILANIFSPLFLITVTAYLIATFYQGKSPLNDRDFLISFNGLLLVILALTIFSVSGKRKLSGIQLSDYINVILIGITLLVNITALSAIIFRWIEYGTTINRIVVTGANLLIFIHLLLLLIYYSGYILKKTTINQLKSSITSYLPVYTVWSLTVSIVIPLAFQFK